MLSHDVMAAILVFQNNEMAAILVALANPVEVDLHPTFLFQKVWKTAGHSSEMLYSYSAKLEWTFKSVSRCIIQLFNNSSSKNKGNHDSVGGLDTRSLISIDFTFLFTPQVLF